MADRRRSSGSSASLHANLESNVSLLQPSKRRRRRPQRLFRLIRSVFRSFPIVNLPKCIRLSPSGGPLLCLPDAAGGPQHPLAIGNGTRVTGTLYGPRKGRVSLALQDSPSCLPTLVMELAIQTQVILREMSFGMLRIALECEKRPEQASSQPSLLEEPFWTIFCSGRKRGYAVRREATEEDLSIMESLHNMSIGAGVLSTKEDLPSNYSFEHDGGGGGGGGGGDGEIAYMRCNFEHLVGSRDSETLYMLSPDGNTGPDLTIFFVRI